MGQGPLLGYDYKPGDLMVTIDVVELHHLRTMALRWKAMLDQVKEGYELHMANPKAFGPVKTTLWVVRNVNEGGLISQLVHATEIPTEMLTWPFSK